MSDFPSLKAQLRRIAIDKRDALGADWRAQASQDACERALALSELHHASPVGGFWPIKSEIDPRPLMFALHKRGQQLALSQVTDPILTFRRWRPNDSLVKGASGVFEPQPEAEQVAPQALLVPLLAFDRRGGRLGYGRSHFDRAIAALSSSHKLLTIGLAFSAQEVDAVPLESHDRMLDIIVTETESLHPQP